jgi:hypothetical protein
MPAFFPAWPIAITCNCPCFPDWAVIREVGSPARVTQWVREKAGLYFLSVWSLCPAHATLRMVGPGCGICELATLLMLDNPSVK